MARARRAMRARSRSSPSPARTDASRRSGRCIRRRSGWSARSAISTASSRSALPDTRPWLDHGFWDVQHPLGQRGAARRRRARPIAFLPAEGEGLHQIPVGPVHAGIIEPGHFRFTANGETVVRLEERLGYVHKGIEALMAGATARQAARLAGRISGDSTVAYALAFARAVEAALRGRGAAARDLSARADGRARAPRQSFRRHRRRSATTPRSRSCTRIAASCASGRLRAADACFGHRLMMDRIVPGGVARDLAAGRRRARCARCSATSGDCSRSSIELYDNTASLQDRTVTTGILRAELARQFGAGGYVGRASGRAFDARKTPRLSALRPARRSTCRCLTAGDVNARVWMRIREVEQSLALIEQILRHAAGRRDPDRDRATAGGTREGSALVEGVPRRRAGLAAARRRPRRALPSARSVLVPVAAAGSRDRGQHRRRLSRSATNRSTAPIRATISRSSRTAACARILFESLIRRPLTEPPPAPDDDALAELARERRPRGAPAARPQPVDPRGRCRLLQRLRARNPRAQQRLLRSRALRPALRRLAAPCRRAAGDRAGHHATCARRSSAPTTRRPIPKWVVAVGDCALDGGIFSGSYAVVGGVFGRRARRSAHPRLPAAPDAVAQGPAVTAGGLDEIRKRSAREPTG